MISKPIKKPDLEKEVMDKVMSGQLAMKPKWFFAAGSILSLAGLVGLSISAVFLTNIIIFLVRKHGPMGQWRLETMLGSLPWWIPVLAVLGIAGGIWFLKKYDFSYKKNFLLIIAGFVLSIIITAWAVDRLGLNEALSRGGQMRRFYQQMERQDNLLPRGRGRGIFTQPDSDRPY